MTTSHAGAPTQAFLLASVPLVALAALYSLMPVMAPILMQASGMPPELFGAVAGAMGLGSVWLYMANRAFTTALGPVRATIVASFIAAVGAALVLSAQFPFILLGGLLIGFAYASTTPSGSQILADHTPRAYRSTLFSIRQAGVPLGGAIAGLVGSWMVSRYGWQLTLVCFVVGVAVLLPWLKLTDAKFNGAAEKPAFRLARLVAPENLVAPFRIVRAVPELSRISLACVGFAMVQGTVNTYLVTYANTRLGLPLTLAGALFATMQGASVAGRLVLGFVADWLGSPRPVLRVLAVMSAASALLLANIDPDWTRPQMFAAIVFVGLSIATWNGLYLAQIATLVPDAVGDATASATFFVFGTYMIVPPVMTVVITLFGYPAAFSIAAVGAASAGLILGRGKARAS